MQEPTTGESGSSEIWLWDDPNSQPSALSISVPRISFPPGHQAASAPSSWFADSLLSVSSHGREIAGKEISLLLLRPLSYQIRALLF